MKRLLVAIALVFSFSTIFSQEARIGEEMNFYTKELKIEQDQRAALSKIVIRKYEHLASIADLEYANQNLYRSKRRSVYQGTENSIHMILNADQIELWKAYRLKTRKARAEKIKSLQARNASKQDLLDAQYGIID
jgi:light-regulated signal transduction histidine kinase (bacteriophytochrome)